ncbi:DsrE/DsrF/DrsH-like family protein, partial [bacterium]|nr:DsrE/DsrF/DrsH-like family protein [bacterium]
PLHQQLALHGVDVRLGTSVTGFREAGGGLEVDLSEGGPVACEFAVLAIGVRPDSKLAVDAGLDVSDRGAVVVDDHMRTSDPDIYAVGDAVQVTDLVGGHATAIPLAGPANRQGRIAADNIFGRDSAYRHTQGTAICKVFDLAIGMTGMNEKGLQRAERAYEKVYVHPASHAGYYPGAAPMSLKLLFDPGDGRILGAQAVGADGVDKRIDVLATAIRSGLTVYDLEHLELAYAPPYGSAKDPVNYAGFVASNVLRGDVALCHTADVDAPTDGQALLDVRTPAEVEAGTIPGAVNIPVDDLRERLAELPKDKELLVFCAVGLRGYLACRILSQKGFQCRNLTGGYKTYVAAKGLLPKLEPKKMTAPACCSSAASEPTTAIDAKGLQCPGPILKLKEAMDALEVGQSLSIDATDPGFLADAPAWCKSTGNTLVSLSPQGGGVTRAVIAKGGGEQCPVPATGGKGKTIVVFSSDLDRVLAAFIIANGAAAMGSEVTLFFTFWGLNALRRPDPKPVQKSLIEKMFGWMMPKGAGKLKLSKMNMGGLGTAMMKNVMRSKNVASLPELIDSARAAGVRLVACAMSMDVMGIRREELIDGVEEGGVAMYLSHAEAGNVNLFI